MKSNNEISEKYYFFFWKLGEIRVKKKFYIFVQKRKCLFFFKFWYFELFLVVKMQKA